MKKLTLSILVVGAAIGLATESLAQQPGPKGGQGGGQFGRPGQGGQRRVGGMRRLQEVNKKIFAQLGLNADQKKKIEALDKKSAAKMQDLMKDFKPGGDMSGMRDKFRAVREDYNKGLKSILTPAQLKKYEELRKAEMQKMRQQFGGGRGFGGGRPGGAPGPGGGARGGGN